LQSDCNSHPAMAGVSTDHYSRLEQARGSSPSEPVVAALARALRCDLDERDHLFHLAGLSAPPRMTYAPAAQAT
jgi:transcriptional regulator with XRE-family HTH domain